MPTLLTVPFVAAEHPLVLIRINPSGALHTPALVDTTKPIAPTEAPDEGAAFLRDVLSDLGVEHGIGPE